MSMLAEPKRKQKWSLNPRGKAWAQDTNKFGHKMLEKMGWSQGKGLGANEDGMIEHIKVSHKNDSKGIGYKESDDQWTSHESNFSALLEALGGGEQDIDKVKLNSLEEKSQSSRARVHYKKFTRGKDLSKYSEKDLANIFGKKSLKELKKTKDEQMQPSEIVKEDDIKEEDTEKTSFFSNGGLISDYFSKKLPNFGKSNGYVIGNNGVLKKGNDSESESEERPSFGFGFKQENVKNETFKKEESGNDTFVIKTEDNPAKSSFISYIYNNHVEDTPEKKKNKKKRNCNDESMTVEDTPTKKKKLEPREVHEATPIKKKKDKSKKKRQIEEQSGLSNPAFDPLYTSLKQEKHILAPIEESLSESLNGSLNDTVGQVAESFEVRVQINNESTPVKCQNMGQSDDDSIKKKKKKRDKAEEIDVSSQTQEALDESIKKIKKKEKRKSKSTEDIHAMDTSSPNVNERKSSEETSIEGMVKDRKKKSKQNSNESLNNMDPQYNDQQCDTKKKKKSKRKDSQEGLDNPFFNMSVENEESIVPQIENPYEFKVKEKKKKKKNKEEKENYGMENPVFNAEDSVNNSQDVANEEFEVKRKDKSKKKKKERDEKIGLDNLALSLNDTIDESCDLMLNVVTTPIVPKAQNNSLDESSSIQKVARVKRRKSVRFSDVTRERIIPNKEELEQDTLEDSREILEVEGKLNDSSEMTYIDKFIQKKKTKKRKQEGLDNTAFDKQANIIEENITSISKTLDTYQAEIENDMNEAKLKSVEIEDIMVGEVGNPDGSNEKLSDGTVKIKFKNANFSKTAKYIDGLTGSKKAYKHLIKGDVVLKFKETNLHEIEGYAVKAS